MFKIKAGTLFNRRNIQLILRIKYFFQRRSWANFKKNWIIEYGILENNTLYYIFTDKGFILMKFIFLLVLAFAAGMLAPMQAGMNAKIGKALNDPFYAALISFAVGTAGLLVYALTCRVDLSAIRTVSDVHWTLWLAGLLGAFYVTATIVLAPRLGTALTFGLVVAGQLVMAVIMDHFGLFGMPVQPVNWLRLTGIVLIVGGTMLIRWF